MTILAIRFVRGGDAPSVMEIKFTNDLGDIARVNDAFEEFAEREGLPDRVRRSIKLVFDELLNNIISYAFGDAGDDVHHLEVRVESTSAEISVTISDDGHLFDPFSLEAPDTTLPIDEREIGGLGIHLVRQLMDEVSYVREDDRNVVVLTKRLASAST
jgi:sigma-B regulation protein RsbU (phosphoserine phosphatase)